MKKKHDSRNRNYSLKYARDNDIRIQAPRELCKSTHARKRQQQRCISDRALDLLNRYGCRHHDNHGCCKVFHNKQSRKLVQNELNHANYVAAERDLNAYMIVDDDIVITTAWRTRRMKK